ncbi:Ig-like domain repeat protein [Streptomyces sp. NPDC053367]|uniref:Ig-like domain repeat protein n=1 Tax=Streptomyces sp. NPDC053367 TaxID=3365700 RepID=UPI0037D36467
MRIRTLPAATALAVLFSSAVLTATQASADTDRPVAVYDADDTVVDGVHQRIFFSDRSRDQIVATTYSGTVVGTVSGLPQVRDLVITPDSKTVYAAVQGADKIVAIDTEQLTKTAEYPTGTGTIPSTVAYTDGTVWFGYGDQWDSGLGAVDLTPPAPEPAETPAPAPTVRLGLDAGHDWSSPPMLYADPDNPGTLVALDGHISSGPMVVYDVSSGTPAIRTSATPGGFHRDAALKPDGQSIVVAGPGSRALTEYRLSDLSVAHTYPVADQPLSVDVAPDGTVAATVRDVDDLGDTYVFSGGPAKPASVRNLTHQWMPEWGHQLNWSADGSRLFVLTGDSENTRFHRIDEPRKYLTTATVSAPATAPRAKPLTVTGTLVSGAKLPAGTPITVTRTDMESPDGRSLGTKTLGTGGKFSFSDTPYSGGKVRYTVRYAGDATHTPAAASDTVEVSRATPALTLNNNGRLYSYGADVRFTAHLGTTYKNRTVELWADPFGTDRPKRLIRSGTVNSAGNISGVVDMARDTTVYAVFKGDSRYKPRTVKVTAYAKVRVSTSVSRHYRTAKIGSTTYAWFHKNTNPLITTAMPAYPGRMQRFDLQAYYQGGWHTLA